ncbi:uncharacterized protein JCM6883_006865 [Sporobolomyces salmoneus]|uniref:uncharacterized protein n=1 Tax=Sporobolomyces salmoneus TaxID=183962 RepID=UPI00317A0018
MVPETRSLIIYGPHLFPTRLSKLLKDLSPISSSTVVVPKAFLAFNVKGIPFLEPCYANCVVRGFNDRRDRYEDSSTKGGEEGEEDGGESEEYKRWIWNECSTGADYEGNLPHPLEGMVFELVLPEFDVLLRRLLEASPPMPYSLVPVHYTPFVNGDSDEPTSTSEKNRAEIVVFDSSLRPTERHLQPTQQYLAMILRGAFFTGPLTRTYLSHLTLLRPYDPTSSRSKRLMRRLVQLILLPQFLIFWIPSKVIPGFGLWNRVVGEKVCRGWGVLEGLERMYERWTGKSGWRN